MSDVILRVAVDAPLAGPLTYRSEAGLELPPEARDLNYRGASVLVPLGRRTVNAVVLGEATDVGNYTLKPITAANPERPRLPEPTIRWLEWLSDYYHHPIGQVTALAFPPLKRLTKRGSKKSPVVPDRESHEPPILTREQRDCLDGIRRHRGFSVHLLHGVTGSGKTEVYLRLLEDVITRGQKGIVLVPEISLTPQLIQRFSSRFPRQVAVIHSHLTEREKTDQWWSVVDGEKKILIGARSALFCPIENLGLIVIDEEHEPSFKQEEKLKYHARDAAIMLAKCHNCPIVLGSATPSLESWRNALEGKFLLHTMKGRVSDRRLPEIHVVDLRTERRRRRDENRDGDGTPFWASDLLLEKMRETLESGEQVALFLNRRGMAQTVHCPACGHVEECPNCSISLTLHGKDHLVCHYCDFDKRLKERCSSCPDGEPQALGLGTERLEEDVRKLFPQARIARADRDEIQSREDLEHLISDMESGAIEILIGTQMIAKGLDFPKLTLVGLVLADVGFNLPDFRASERSFQLLTQVSGRSGRHSARPGQVVIQTYNPEHLSVTYTTRNDYVGFAAQELELRRDLGYPPYGRLCSLRIQGIDLDRVSKTADALARRARKLHGRDPRYAGVQILGPAPAPLSKLKGRHRYHLLLKFPSAAVMGAFQRQLLADLDWVPAGVKLQADVDPMNML